MNNVLAAISLVSIMSMIACTNSNHSSDNAPVNNIMPASINTHALAQKPPMTRQQRQDIANLMTGLEVMPAADLFVGTSSQDSDLRKMRGDQLAIYNQIKNRCAILSPPPTKTGSTQVGVTMTETKVASIRGGIDCPVNYSENGQYQTITTKNNSEELKAEYFQNKDRRVFDRTEFAASFSGSSNSSNQILARDLQTRAGILNSATQTRVDGLISHTNLVATKYTNMSMTMTLQTTAADIATIAVTAEILSKNSATDSYTELNYSFRGANPTIQAFTSNGRTRYFLNGQQISLMELKRIFGNDFSLGSSAN